MVSLAARSATVGFPRHTSALILIQNDAHVSARTCMPNGEWNLRHIEILVLLSARLFILSEFTRGRLFARARELCAIN